MYKQYRETYVDLHDQLGALLRPCLLYWNLPFIPFVRLSVCLSQTDDPNPNS